MATFAVATIAGPLLGGLLVDGPRLALGVLRQPAARARRAGRPAPHAARRPRRRSSRRPLRRRRRGAAGRRHRRAHARLHLGRQPLRLVVGRRSSGSLAAGVALAAALVLRERRAADPIVPLDLLRTRTVAVACAALFLTTASLFAVNVFVPLFLQVTTGASPTEAGLLLVPTMARHHAVDEHRRAPDRHDRPLPRLSRRSGWR